MGNGPAWQRYFQNWPKDIPPRGLLVTSFDEQVPFDGFLTTDTLLLVLNNGAGVVLPRISSEPTTGEEGSPLKQVENWPASLHVDPTTLSTHKSHEGKDYLVWHYTPAGGASAEEYLVDLSG